MRRIDPTGSLPQTPSGALAMGALATILSAGLLGCGGATDGEDRASADPPLTGAESQTQTPASAGTLEAPNANDLGGSTQPTAPPAGESTHALPPGNTVNSDAASADSGDASADPGIAPSSGEAPANESGAPSAPISEVPPVDPVQAPPPLQLVSSETDLGRGNCRDTSVADVVRGIHEAQPELSDITLFSPDPVLDSLDADVEVPGPDASYYRAVITAEGQIVVALRRCEGDVVDLACSDERWWYFETDSKCAPVAAGEYRQLRQGDCFETEGTPSALFDAPVRERDVCGYDARSEDLRGSYELRVFASGQLCPEGENYEVGTLLDAPVVLEIDQDPDSLRDATVTLHSEQFPCLDGSSFPAEVIGDLVEADDRSFQDGDALECFPTRRLTFSFSFGGALIPPFAGILDYWQITNDPCTASVPEYVPTSGFHFMFDGG